MAKKKKPAKKKKLQSDKVLAPDQALWREANGNFKRGNPGGPGRPFLRQARFLVAINEAVTENAWLAIVKRAIKDAKCGDRHAREWLSKWLLGQPDAVKDEKRTIIEVLTDDSFLEWIESEGHKGGSRAS